MSETMTPPARTPICPPGLTPECPWHSPNWRWDRAAWRVQTQSRRGERLDDDWVRLAIRCVHALRRVARGRRPYRPDPELMQARQLAQHRDWNRAELEARILADQPISEISSAMGVSTRLISAFEALFFDVRPRLGARGWILHEVIGLRPWGPLLPQDVAVAWKFYAFSFGVCTLDVLLAGADRADLEVFGLPAYWSARSRLPKEAQFALVAHSLPQAGMMALRSLNRLEELGLCEVPPRVVPPPEGLALDLTLDTDLDLASWDEQPDTQGAAPEVRFARVA